MNNTQIFRNIPEPSILYKLLEQISYKKNGGYIVDINVYKKLLFHNLHVDFLSELMDYYYVSKQFYLTRPFTYKVFSTILRQLCNGSNITIKSRVLYIESIYTTEYTIYLDP